MKALKYFSLFLIGFGFVGCAQPNSTAEKTRKAESATAPTEVFKSKLPDNAPTLKVATTGTVVPFTFQDDYGNMTGLDIDIIREVGEREGFKVQFFKESWQTIFGSVESGKNDIAIGSIKYTPERAEKFAISTPYFYNPAAIMYKNPQLNIKGFNDLKGLKVAALQNTTHYNKLKETNIAAEIVPTKSTFLAYQMLINNKVDAVAINYGDSKVTALKHPEFKVFLIPYEDRKDPMAQLIILAKKDNTKLQAQINEGLEKITADGTLKKLEDKWQLSEEDGVTDNAMPQSATTTTNKN